MRATGFPYVALLVLQDGRMTLVYRHEGRRGPGGCPEGLLQGLSAAMERFQPVLVAAQADRVEREATTVSGRRCVMRAEGNCTMDGIVAGFPPCNTIIDSFVVGV